MRGSAMLLSQNGPSAPQKPRNHASDSRIYRLLHRLWRQNAHDLATESAISGMNRPRKKVGQSGKFWRWQKISTRSGIASFSPADYSTAHVYKVYSQTNCVRPLTYRSHKHKPDLLLVDDDSTLLSHYKLQHLSKLVTKTLRNHS